MDEHLRKIERQARAGDLAAKLQLERERERAGLLPELDLSQISPFLRTIEIELDIALTLNESFYELDGLMAECYYEVDGQDVPATYWDPGDSAQWLLYHVLLIDQDQIDDYNREAYEEGYAPLPFTTRTDIYPYLSEEQRRRLERRIEEIDRAPDY